MCKFEVSGEITEREPFKCCRNTGSGAALPNDLKRTQARLKSDTVFDFCGQRSRTF